MAKSTDADKMNPVSQLIAFFQDSWVELKKVHAPTRQETIQATIVVMIMVVLFSLFLGLADLVVGRLMQSILT